MASAAATVFFCRPGRMSRRAVLTGLFVCAGVVCAHADAASNSKAAIARVFFMLSSFFGKSLPRAGEHEGAVCATGVLGEWRGLLALPESSITLSISLADHPSRKAT